MSEKWKSTKEVGLYDPKVETKGAIVRIEASKLNALKEQIRDYEAALELNQKLMNNLMEKGNIDWGKTFSIDFGLLNTTIIETDKALAKWSKK